MEKLFPFIYYGKLYCDVLSKPIVSMSINDPGPGQKIRFGGKKSLKKLMACPKNYDCGLTKQEIVATNVVTSQLPKKVYC